MEIKEHLAVVRQKLEAWNQWRKGNLNEEHLAILRQGIEAWNQWRKGNRDTLPELSEANLSEANLSEANLSDANLRGANLNGANLNGANLNGANLMKADLSGATLRAANLAWANLAGAGLREADLREAQLVAAWFTNADLSRAKLGEANCSGVDLSGADLSGALLDMARLSDAKLTGADLSKAMLIGTSLMGAKLTGADLSKAMLTGANLTEADLSGADLSGADLTMATLLRTNFQGANLMGCSVHGIAAWDVNLVGAQQAALVITPHGKPVITVDDLEVAQFIYLLLHNEKIRHVIETVTSKAVLILGRFAPKRKAVLDAIREALRRQNYVPILFDFEGPESRDFTETISTLARMARFIIADLTEPSSLPKELEAIVPTLAVPVQPLLTGATPYSMFQDYWKYRWVLPIYHYESLEGLIASLRERVIAPAEAKVRELTELRAQAEAQLMQRPATG